jgi:hypothetical protein
LTQKECSSFKGVSPTFVSKSGDLNLTEEGIAAMLELAGNSRDKLVGEMGCYKEITGDLNVQDPRWSLDDLVTDELEDLVRRLIGVGGNVILTNVATRSIDWLRVATVGGSVRLANNRALVSITMWSPTVVGGDVAITGHTALESIHFGGPLKEADALQTVGGTFTIESNEVLARMSGAEVASIGSLEIRDNAALVSLQGVSPPCVSPLFAFPPPCVSPLFVFSHHVSFWGPCGFWGEAPFPVLDFPHCFGGGRTMEGLVSCL